MSGPWLGDRSKTRRGDDEDDDNDNDDDDEERKPDRVRRGEVEGRGLRRRAVATWRAVATKSSRSGGWATVNRHINTSARRASVQIGCARWKLLAAGSGGGGGKAARFVTLLSGFPTERTNVQSLVRERSYHNGHLHVVHDQV